jgi:uncharacterized protein
MHLTRLASLHRLTPEQSLLINALSGAIDLVDNETRGQILGLGLRDGPAPTGECEPALIERGYLFADEGAERAALSEVHQACAAFGASRPMQFVLCPTYQCNLVCSYCFEPVQLRRRPEIMTDRQADDAFSAIQALSSETPGRSCQVVLFGGEPLLPETQRVVEAILTRAESESFPVHAVTNGTHLCGFVSVFERHPGVVRGAQVTLDGPESIHDARRGYASGRGSFAEVVEGVEACLSSGIEVNLRVNLDAHNAEHLEELADFLAARGWIGRPGFRCQLAPVTDHQGSSSYPHMMREDELVAPVLNLWARRPDLKEVLDFRLFRVLQHLISVIEPGNGQRDMPRFHYCEADRGDIFTFGPDGRVYICPETVGASEYAIGTYSPRYRIRRERRQRWTDRNVLALPECRECNIATFCGGGCGYAALRQFGNPMHGLCAGAPEIVKAYIDSLRERWSGDQPAASAGQRAGYSSPAT